MYGELLFRNGGTEEIGDEERMMRVSMGKDMRCRIVKNLLSAHQQIADSGNVNALIVLTKFILKLSKQFDDEFFELGQKEQAYSSE